MAPRKARLSVKGAVKRRAARKGHKRPSVKYKHRLKYSPKVREIAEKSGELPAYGWPGGYPIYYFAGEGGRRGDIAVVCPKCASGHGYLGSDDKIIDYAVNYEDPELFCEACNKRIESAYAEDDAK